MTDKILLIYTGGTIGMKKNAQGVLIPFDFSNITEQIPALKRLNIDIDTYSFDTLIDSSNVDAPFWVEIAQTIIDNYDKYCGFVILHGTDTMAYTSSILSFMLQGLNKPVILTGSQLPIESLRSDGRANLITAIEIASASSRGETTVTEVAVCFEQRLYRGNRITKHFTDKFDAFKSHNYPPLARVGINITYDEKVMLPSNNTLQKHLKLDNQIETVRIHPCMRETEFDKLCEKGVRVILLQSYGTGNAPTYPWFLNKIEKAINQGIIVANVSQCPGGYVDMGIYQTSTRLQEIGVLNGSDLTEEAAITKMIHLLGTYDDNDTIKELFQSNLVGEMSIK